MPSPTLSRVLENQDCIELFKQYCEREWYSDNPPNSRSLENILLWQQIQKYRRSDAYERFEIAHFIVQTFFSPTSSFEVNVKDSIKSAIRTELYRFQNPIHTPLDKSLLDDLSREIKHSMQDSFLRFKTSPAYEVVSEILGKEQAGTDNIKTRDYINRFFRDDKTVDIDYKALKYFKYPPVQEKSMLGDIFDFVFQKRGSYSPSPDSLGRSLRQPKSPTLSETSTPPEYNTYSDKSDSESLPDILSRPIRSFVFN